MCCMRVRDEFDVGRHLLGLPRLFWWLRIRSVRGEVEEVRHQVGAGHAVDGRVVDLRDEADLAVFEPLEEVQLPQRTASVERQAGDVGDDLGQLAHRARRADRTPVDVRFEVEVGVLDPHRVPEVERNGDEPAAERLEKVQSGP